MPAASTDPQRQPQRQHREASEALRIELAALGAPVQPERAPACSRDESIRILIASDEVVLHVYLRSCLPPRWHVVEVEDGRTALDQARARPPDCIIADVHLPELDGFALCTALAAHPCTAAVPVLLISGQPPANAAPTADDVAVLVKPFSCARLARTVERLLAGRTGMDGG